MTEKFRALKLYQEDGKTVPKLETLAKNDLGDGEILIKSEYSSVNFKDALGITGEGKIQKSFPLIPGIDVAGTVTQSSEPGIAVGSKVLVTGCGLGEVHNGGYSEYVRVPKEWVIPLPAEMSTREAMIYGTAGFTAGLCLQRLIQNGQVPEMGPIVVTGATGGVGSLAVPFLKKSGFSVIAVSGKESRYGFLKEAGAEQACSLEQLDLGERALEKARFGGAIDNLGGAALEGLMRHTQLWGSIAVVGLALSPKFQNTVMPLILRGVSLLGISSNNCPRGLRERIWADLAGSLKPENLESYVSGEIGLEDLPDFSRQMIDRKTYGRTLVKL